MAIDPNIAMSFKPTTELNLQPMNILAQYGQMSQLRNADLQAQQLQMQMDKLRRTDEAMERIRQTAVKNGGPGDLNEIANAFLQSPDLGHQELGLKIFQQQRDKADFEKMYSEMFGASPMAATSTAPAAPVNTLAPATPAPVNTLAPGATPTADSLRQQIMMFSTSSDPRAKAMVDVLKGQLAEITKPFVVGGRLVTGAGKELYAAPPETSDIKEYEYAKKNQGYKGSFTDFVQIKPSAGASRQMMAVNTQLPASEEAQKEFMKESRQTYSALKNAPQVLENIDAAKKLVPQAKGFMGAGGESVLQAASFLNNRLGTNIDTKGVESAEELRSRLFLGILDNLKKLDSQPSQQQQEALRIALGSIGTDPNALPRVLNVFEESIRTKVGLYNQEVGDAEQRGVKFPYNPKIKLPAAPSGAGGLSPAEQAELDQLRARYGTQPKR